MASQLNVDFIRKLYGSLIDIIHGCVYDQALADVRPTGAGIKFLFCSSRYDFFIQQMNLYVK